MKRLIHLAFAASLAFATLPTAAAPASSVQLVSRAEAVKAVVESSAPLKERLAAFREHMPPLPLYLDVPQDSSLAPYLEAAFDQGVILGNRERAFRPTQPITVEELTAMYARTAAIHDQRAAAVVESENPGEPWYSPAQRALTQVGLESPKNLGTNAYAARGSFLFMTAQLSSFTASHPVQHVADYSSVAVASSSSSVASVSSSGIPQYLPIRLNPLPTPSSEPASPAVNQEIFAPQAVVAAAQINANTPSIVTQNQPATQINAGGGGTTGGGSAFIDVVSASQPVTINAGGNDDFVDAGDNAFTITIPSLKIGPITVSSPDDPFSHNGLLAPLQQGLGHLFGNPGGGGKILVYGHSSSYPWDTSSYTKIFRRINELNPGDEILITYGGQEYRYRVTYEETVPAKDMSAYQDDGSGEDLILYTCWPPDSITQRYLVHAKPV